MSVPRISKRVTDRQKRYEFVDGLVREQRADVIDALTLLFQGDGTSPKPDVSAYLDGLLGVMKHSFDDLVRAERIHLNELSGDGGSRRRRDNAVSGLREVLLDMRSLLRGAFGVERTEALGFERRIAPHPQPLLRQALRIEGQLRAREIEVPEPRFRGVSIRLELLADELRPHLRELRETIDEVTEDLARVQGTQVAKDQAMKTFDRTYRQVVDSLVSAFRLAGKPELADRIPTSFRRRKRRRAAAKEAPPQGEASALLDKSAA